MPDEAKRREFRLRPADIIPLVIVAVLYVLAAKLGLRLAFVHASATAVWPPAGIALAALLLRGYRIWPAVFVGAFVANVTTAGSIATSLGIAGGNSLEALTARIWSRASLPDGRRLRAARMWSNSSGLPRS